MSMILTVTGSTSNTIDLSWTDNTSNTNTCTPYFTNAFWNAQGTADVWTGTTWTFDMHTGLNIGLDAGSRSWTVGFRPTLCEVTASCVPNANVEIDVFDQNGLDFLGSTTVLLTSTPQVVSIPLSYAQAILNSNNPDIGQIGPFQVTPTAANVTFHDIEFCGVPITAAAYNLARGNVVIAHLANNVFSLHDTGLTPNTTYHYSITGVDGSNNNIYTPALANGTTMSIPLVSFLSALNGDQFFTANGALNIGGKIYTYSEGSLIACNTYTSVTGSTLNPNPLIINTNGVLNTEIWTQTGTNTRVRIMDSSNVLQQDLDNIPGVPFIPAGLTQVLVIDSIFSTDTANASSANSTNWVYKVANAAYGQANTDANAISNLIANVAGLSTTTLKVLSGNVTINIGNTINFNNTAFANIAVTPFGNNAVNVAIFANGSVGSNTTNGSVTIGGTIIQWAFYSHTENGVLGPFTDDFPSAFPNGCVHVQLTPAGAAGTVPLSISSFTKSSFTWFTGHGDSPTTGQYVLAIGF